MISRIDHIQFKVPDPEAEAAYLEQFGLVVRKRVPETGAITLTFPGQEFPYIKVLPPKGNEQVGLDHVSFDLTDGAAERERLAAVGIKCEKGYEGKWVPSFHHEVSNLRSPNGLLWQLTEENVPER